MVTNGERDSVRIALRSDRTLQAVFGDGVHAPVEGVVTLELQGDEADIFAEVP